MALYLSRRHLLAIGLAATALPAWAALRSYELVLDTSRIVFEFDMSGTPQQGTVPVARTDIQVDPQNLSSSKAQVSADIRQATTGFIFATQALKSAEVLNAEAFPLVEFASTKVHLGRDGRISEGARITGNLTLRGVTRPISLDATLTRPTGTDPDDLSVLYVSLKGALSRTAFGATGFSSLVADTVNLDIFAEIRARA